MKVVRAAIVVGALALSAPPVVAAPVLLNGDFEAGDFGSWTATPAAISLFGVGTPYPHTGQYAAFFGGVNDGRQEDTISQAIATTAGQRYLIDFWLAEVSPACTPATPNCLSLNWSVSWNGAIVHSHIADAAFGYTEFAFEVAATGPASTLSFALSDEPGFYYLDDISVAASDSDSAAAVPEPASLLLLEAGIASLLITQRRA